MATESTSHKPYPVIVNSLEPNRVLVVDDEPAVLFAYRKIIEKDGISVDICENLEEALLKIRNCRYLAVIADMRLAGTDNGDGLEILRCVRQEHPETKTILATGYGDSRLENMAREIGITRFFKKPVQPAEILEVIKN